ncbi:hypothetical protein [Chryseobacterium echinoideorum]|uniref:hypothetical protein n=1 Tax=Chryseobacterium echinoideorum TaxID=1549648 RepID=UPI001184A2F3|nr:hypothetical protein [Chryseobacterium echinoideorum]
MAYTVISVFPSTVNSEDIISKLKNHGINNDDIIVSRSNVESAEPDHQYEEDEKTKSFWDHLFVNDNELLHAYKTKSVGSLNIVVYADTFEKAQNAKSILDENGAIEVYKKTDENRVDNNASDLPQDVYNGIIAKARHNLYFLGSERVYHSNVIKGMDDPMDDLGSED